MSAPSPFQLEHAMAALMAVRQRLLEEDPTLADDEKLLTDMLDGESGDAMQVIHRMIRASLHASSMATAAKIRSQDMMTRSSRYDKRAEVMRSAVMSAMEALGTKRIEEPDFLATVGGGGSAVTVSDENQLPDDLVTITRTPKKKEIAAAIAAERKFEGATLTNTPPRLTIRTR